VKPSVDVGYGPVGCTFDEHVHAGERLTHFGLYRSRNCKFAKAKEDLSPRITLELIAGGRRRDFKLFQHDPVVHRFVVDVEGMKKLGQDGGQLLIVHVDRNLPVEWHKILAVNKSYRGHLLNFLQRRNQALVCDVKGDRSPQGILCETNLRPGYSGEDQHGYHLTQRYSHNRPK